MPKRTHFSRCSQITTRLALVLGGMLILPGCSDSKDASPRNVVDDVGTGGIGVDDASSGGTGGVLAASATGGVSQSGGAQAVGGSDGSGGTQTGGSPSALPVDWPLINGLQWADTDGNPIQAHGGGMLKVGADYYWFGENRNPDGTFFAVSAYRSQDLRRWEHVSDVLTMDTDPGLKPANVERPKVVYNETTQTYVMWMHWENGQHYGEARAAVASSKTVDGDYTYHGSFRPYQEQAVVDHDRPGYMSRDCTLFVDDDGRAYFLSSSNENYDLHLYSLTDDYLSVAKFEGKLFEGGHREAPALFKRGETYFLVTSGSTGWDPNQAKYATSSSLTSGWSALKNVGNNNTFYSQSTYVQPVEGTGGTEYLYMGDRWAGSWGGRVNDSFYIWQPISFPSATSMTMDWFNTLDIDTTLGALSGEVNDFVFINKQSGKVLAVEGAANQNGADLVQQDMSQASAFAWKLSYNGAGYFSLTNQEGGKVIDVPDESTASGVALHLWDGNGGDHQLWRVIDQGEGDFRVRNKKSGHYLSVVAGSLEAGAAVEQQADSDGDEQVWRLDVAR